QRQLSRITDCARLKGKLQRQIGLNSCPAVKSAFKELRHCNVGLDPNEVRVEDPADGEEGITTAKHGQNTQDYRSRLFGQTNELLQKFKNMFSQGERNGPDAS
ncbi:hypothetical protein AVEN_8970-1, partial [Araneus ventricosus]